MENNKILLETRDAEAIMTPVQNALDMGAAATDRGTFADRNVPPS
jgi:hypothetical protein